MPTFEVAHINEQGIDLIIVLVSNSFGGLGTAEQKRQTGLLQVAATSAGMAGTVVPVWEDGFGSLAFLAPREWHPFFESLTTNDLLRNVNRTLTTR